jgi:hypothetical protein
MAAAADTPNIALFIPVLSFLTPYWPRCRRHSRYIVALCDEVGGAVFFRRSGGQRAAFRIFTPSGKIN